MRYEKNLEVYVSPQQTELFGDVRLVRSDWFEIEVVRRNTTVTDNLKVVDFHLKNRIFFWITHNL